MESKEVRGILLNKHCGALQDPNKRERKQALERIRKELMSSEDEDLICEFEGIQKHLLRSLHDESEAVRECVVLLLTDILQKMKCVESVLGNLFPELRVRLGGSEIKEQSEEVRLLMVTLLRVVIAKYDKDVAPYLNDYVDILKKTIIDPYPDVKKASCECAAELGKAIPMEFHYQSESLIKPMLQALGHQHSRIRVAVIKSLGEVILYGNNCSINDVAQPLAERSFDQNATVRLTIARIVGMWLSKLRDRYSYFHKLIPLMLTSLLDEIKEQAEEVWRLWEAAGEQWVQENETDLKNKLDFLPGEISWYPNGVRRPNLGCRELVQREMTKFIPGIINELTDWKVDVRVKSAQLLCTTIQHAEQRITQSLAKLFPPMYKAFCDEDNRVYENVKRSAELIGYFVPVDVYCSQILPSLEETTSTGNLGILASAVQYSPAGSIETELANITKILNSDDCCFTVRASEHHQILYLVGALLKNCAETCYKDEAVRQNLFNVLVSVQALSKSKTTDEIVKDLFTKLNQCGENKDENPVVKCCTSKLLQRLQVTMDNWTAHSPQLSVFELLFADYVDGISEEPTLVLSMLSQGVGENMDPEVVLRVLWTILKCLQTETFISNFKENDLFFREIMTDILVKRLVWKAGRSAEALRIAAAACFDQGLKSMLANTSIKIDRDLLDLFLPHILSLIEDQAEKTRIFTCDALTTLLMGAKSQQTLTTEDVNKLITVVMKRLDDVSNQVRTRTLSVINMIHTPPNAVPCSENVNSLLYSTLLVHLDDPDEKFRLLVLDTLKIIGKLDAKGILEKLSLDTFRDKQISKELHDYLKIDCANT
ncbi:dynein assembly factor 5, axonemal isoform X2 [Nilaparvata lugens]|uniref:dynein assembly factor 5, axonemal isoform X2 n=1 Tax=Nilaparvata lugens TaxID=108931 RepID=UPI00193D1204|nr:dynein assembly factor 5, axonemal isoform X2 [Nilaparvata lugens]